MYNIQKIIKNPGLARRLAGYSLAILIVLLAAESSSAFTVPEKLVYDLTWTGVKAGTAVLEVANEKDLIRITSTANSAGWVSVFYTVEDRVESVLEKGKAQTFIGRPRKYHIKIREGRHRRDKEINFDFEKKKALLVDNLAQKKNEYAFEKNEVFDPLSVLFYVRTLKLEVGKPVYADVIDSKKLWTVEVQVLRREKIQTILGEIDTVVIKPLMQSEGIFSRKGDIHIWLTDDQKHIPVKMQTKVAVGSVTAMLVSGAY